MRLTVYSTYSNGYVDRDQISRSFGQLVVRSVNLSLDRSVGGPVGGSVGKSVVRLVVVSINWYVDQSVVGGRRSEV